MCVGGGGEALHLLLEGGGGGRLIEVYQETAVRLSVDGRTKRREAGSCVAVQDMTADRQTADCIAAMVKCDVRTKTFPNCLGRKPVGHLMWVSYTTHKYT